MKRMQDNTAIAARLDEAADLLEAQGADRFRVGSYRDAAARLRGLGRPVADIHAEGGRAALIALPDIGERLSRAIVEMLSTGRWAQLERLRGDSAPEALFRTLPGIGPALARTLHETLHVDTLEALEVAAHDGQLEGLHGIGPRRAQAIRDSLAQRLARRSRVRSDTGQEPGVGLLLEIDAHYRAEAAAGRLPQIAPRRFNPDGRAWLPILHADRDGWSFTALHSNTGLAHRLGRTGDWVVIHFSHDATGEGQRTVVTETRGPLKGRRVVRGREAECLQLAGHGKAPTN
ncbi:DNA-binding protein [Halovulum dunhuangense]|uniref:DNA-binding protein n=1 Tax=Halovulum dunhuangense TaxID=1505036 RepID=A0A849L677_9RHOB|nr:helix-hairpin-helix domain-containing protein [Halovulum dunhuangense]NNU81662.1 DNA-binding protein [Halovulum dunhuangense]